MKHGVKRGVRHEKGPQRENAETLVLYGAEDRNRTGTICKDRRILSPVSIIFVSFRKLWQMKVCRHCVYIRV